MIRVDLRSDRGSGTVLTLAVAGAVLVLAVGLALLVQAVAAHARAQSVADLSALAAARQLQRATFGVPGSVDACTLAGEVAAHDGGRLSACQELPRGRVRVEALVRTSVGVARAAALAGPSS